MAVNTFCLSIPRIPIIWSVMAMVMLGPTLAWSQGEASRDPETVQALLERPLTAEFVLGEVIVKLKPAVGARALPPAELAPLGLRAARQTSGGEMVYQFAPSKLLQLQSEAAAREEVLAVVQELNARPDVEYAQPNWILHPVSTVPNDPGFSDQWHYRNHGNGANESPGGINLPKAWDMGTGDPSVAVAVIDTGILPNHSDIAGSPNLGTGFDMISDAFIANDGDGRDNDPTDPGDAVAAGECGAGQPPRPLPDSWHGTHVAGTVGVGNTNNATGVAGVNWQVTVLPVRVLGKCGGSIVDINDGIRWAAGLPVPGTPANSQPARVINLSLGGPVPCAQSPATQSAINDAVAAGATVVVAAGNDAQDAAGFLPASCDNVITVAASEARGHLATRYSNFGQTVEIMAPGGDVRRDDTQDGKPDGVLSMVQGGYAFYNGTSMAAPHVAGVTALLLAAEPSLTPAEVLNRIQQNAIPRDATHCPQPCGAGLLNAYFEKERPPEAVRYQYAAKLVCGAQQDPKSLQLTRGVYATTINIHNLGQTKVIFTKKLALTVPPGGQQPGKVLPIAKDGLEPNQALTVDCDDLRQRVFEGRLPASVIEGFVVIESPQSLDVTAVYTTATLTGNGLAKDHTGIHVEQVHERVIKAEKEQPDLVVEEIDLDTLQVSCPSGAGSCVTTVEVTIANQGTVAAGAFTTRVLLDPAQSVTVDEAFGSLGESEVRPFTVTSPPGGNCFDPDCTVCVTVDDLDEVAESDETNNTLCKTKPG